MSRSQLLDDVKRCERLQIESEEMKGAFSLENLRAVCKENRCGLKELLRLNPLLPLERYRKIAAIRLKRIMQRLMKKGVA